MSRAGAGAVLGFVLADLTAAHAHIARATEGFRAILEANAPLPGEDAYAQGKRLLAADDATGALGAFRQAVTQAPQSVDALNGIAVSYDRLGRSDLARAFYEAGLSIEPTSVMLRNNLGYSLLLQGKREEARAPLGVAAAGDDPVVAESARRTLAMIHALGQTPAAAAHNAAVVVVVVETGSSAWIERTDSGEQRLVLDAHVPPPLRAGVDDAADPTLVAVAAPWTDRDDATLLAHVHREERTEADAVLALARAADVARERVVDIAREHEVGIATAGLPSTTSMLALQAAPRTAAAVYQPAARAALAYAPALPVARAASASAFLALNRIYESANAALLSARWTGDVRPAARAVAELRPFRAHPYAIFESDDTELNAFAERLRGEDQQRASSRNLERLAAQIRDA